MNKKINEMLSKSIQAHKNGELQEAEQGYKKILKKDNKNVDAMHLLGVIYNKIGKPHEASILIKKALKIKPNLVSAYSNLGISLMSLNQHDEAIESFKNALKLDPKLFQALNNIGLVYLKINNHKLALEYFKKAIQLNPNIAEIHNNIGLIYHYLKNFNDSEKSYKRALLINSNYADAYSNLSVIYLKEKRYTEALNCVNNALRIKDDIADANNNKGLILQEYWKFDEALYCFKKAILIDSNNKAANHNLIFHSAINDIERGFTYSKEYGLKCAKERKFIFKNWKSDENNSDKLKIGFVSGDFRKHPVAYFLESFLKFLNKHDFELIAYSNFAFEDGFTVNIKEKFSQFKDITNLNDWEAANLIHNDEVNILFDLSGHSDRSRLPVFSYKPAPIQVSWLGFFASTGLNEIDYFLSDRYLSNADDQKYFTEKIWFLPETNFCFTPLEFNKEVTFINPYHENSEELVIFGNFGRLTKLNDKVIRLWSLVLRNIEKSKLLICSDSLCDSNIVANLILNFEKNGVDKSRLIIKDWNQSRSDHLNLHYSVDIILDTFPYNGGTTSVEALWMGVPVLTLKGNSYVSRMGEGFNKNIGLPDWVADNEEDFIRKAKILTSNKKALTELKRSLKQRVINSPLFDGRRFAYNFETALRKMWQIREDKQAGVSQ